MPRYIDADAFDADCRKRYCTDCNNYNGVKCRACWVDDMLGDVDDAPTVSPDEVRGVVHCRECSHADKDLPGAIYCTMWDAWEVPEDGFCYKCARMEVTSDA